MNRRVLAVSGGVDSIVMLDLVCRDNNYSSGEIIVAHFDHGMRENSAEDAEFVRRKSAEYGVECVVGRAKLGAGASEATAREARYQFLRELAAKCGQAEIWTAHHLDDLVESVAINLIRGTGWRGLAVLDSSGIVRPFLESESVMDKQAILVYAGKHGLEFREDQTNNSEQYLRNRLRDKLQDFTFKRQFYELWQRQLKLKTEIDSVVRELLPKDGEWQRSWFQELGEEVALELLRAGTLASGIKTTHPQLENFRQAILNYRAGTYFNLPDDNLVKIKKNSFKLEPESLHYI